jgi:hypothetical protein
MRCALNFTSAGAAACLLLSGVAAWSFVGGVVAHVGRTAFAVSCGGVTCQATDLPVIDRYQIEWFDSRDGPVNATAIAAEHGRPFEVRLAGFAFGRFDVTDPRDLSIRATTVEPNKPPLSTDTVLIVPLWPFVLFTAWATWRAWRRRRRQHARGFPVSVVE